MKTSTLIFPLVQPTRDQKVRRLKTVVLTAVGVLAAVMLLLLAQGCRHEQSSSTPEFTNTNASVVLLTNSPLAELTNKVAPPNSPATLLAASNAAVVAASNSTEYTIIKGDTLAALAKRFHVPTKAILRMNAGIDPAHMRIGQKIRIPVDASPSGAAPMTKSVAKVPNQSGEYVVKSGDTIAKIAGQWGTTSKAIRRENRLATDKLYVGQVLHYSHSLREAHG